MDLNITSYNLAIFIDREMSKQSFRVNEEKVLQCVGILWLWLKAISWKYTILFGLYSQSFIFLLQERRGKINTYFLEITLIETNYLAKVCHLLPYIFKYNSIYPHAPPK